MKVKLYVPSKLFDIVTYDSPDVEGIVVPADKIPSRFDKFVLCAGAHPI